MQLRALELDAHTARDQLESYMQKYREAIARDADNASPADARVISLASAPRSPTFPKKAETLALSTLAGLLLSTGIVVSQALLAAGSAATPAVAQPVTARREDAQVAPREEPGDDRAAPVEAAADASGDASEGDFRSTSVLAEHLASRAAPGAALLALIAAEASGESLPVATATARELSSRGRTILVDLGATPDGFADALAWDEESDRAPLGLAELMAGEASFEEVIQRDPSSSLDFIPVGLGAVASDGLDEILDALAAAYAFVVIRASDWRSEPALAAIDRVDTAVLVAPASRLAGALAHAREARGGDAGDVVGFVVSDLRSRVERAA